MKKLVEFIITSIVDSPDKVVIDEITENGYTNFLVSVSPSDMGKVIGKRGQIIRSIRNLLRAKAIKENKKIILTLKDQTSLLSPPELPEE